tara:strand:- start:286 stop:936 length:651 start_codon:yes stop_codon:yes gene_type:complete
MSQNFKLRIFTSLVLFLLLYLMLSNNFLLGYFLIIIGILSILEFIKMINKIFNKEKIYAFLINLLFIFYIFCFCTIFLSFSFFAHLKIVIFIILITCIASDIGGFIVGKTFKGKKLTKISPNKTVSGAIGSLIFSTMIISVIIYYTTKNYDPLIIIVGLITSAACQLGDLIISYLKRKSKFKDTGNFLPGHGGVLDRVDGIIVGMPTGFLALTLFY